MKKVLFFSPDFSLCYSLLMYLQDKYNVTSSTDFNLLISLAKNGDFDLVIIDSQPDNKIKELCREIKKLSLKVKIVLTYVYNKNLKETDKELRNCVSAIFYKPIDLMEVSQSLIHISNGTHQSAV